MSPLTHTPIETPAHGWTPERKAMFLDRLSTNGNARAACRSIGMSPESAYKLRRRDPLFARGWAAAVVLGRDNSIQALADRAIEGVEEQIYYRGELVGTRRRYDSRLLLAHLARLDRLADEKAGGEDAGRFDELIACIAAGGEGLPLSRDAYIAESVETAVCEVRSRQVAEYPDLFDEALGNLSKEEAERVKTLDKECGDAAERVGEEAKSAWAQHLEEAFAEVDALCGPPSARILPGLPGAPFSAAEMVGEIASDGKVEGAGISFPCTVSTASTSALAHGLAGPPGGDGAPSRTPLSSPHLMGAPQ